MSCIYDDIHACPTARAAPSPVHNLTGFRSSDNYSVLECCECCAFDCLLNPLRLLESRLFIFELQNFNPLHFGGSDGIPQNSCGGDPHNTASTTGIS